MAGRGRGMVLPAWATRAGATPGMSAAPEQQPPTQQGMTMGRGGGGRMFSAGGPPGMPMQSGVGWKPEEERREPLVAPDGWTKATTEDGKVYYYNQFTQATTYEKPRSLMSEVERKLPTTSWKEYVRDGKSYFFNATTNESVWEEPLEFTRYKERLRALCTGDAPTKDMDSLALYKAARKALDECTIGNRTDTADDQENQQGKIRVNKLKLGSELGFKLVTSPLVGPPRALSKPPHRMDDDDFDKERMQFLEMLRDRRVPTDATWEDAMQFGIANDARFYGLPTTKERKIALEDYVSWRRQELKAELKKELQELADQGKIDGHSKRRECIELLAGKPAFESFAQDASGRDNLIMEFLDDLYDLEKAERKKKRKREERVFETVVQNWLAEKRIDTSTRWDEDFAKDIEEQATKLPDKPEGWEGFRYMSGKDMSQLFEDVLHDEEKRLEEVQERARKHLRSAGKDLLEEFKSWLEAYLRQGEEEIPGSFIYFWSKSRANLDAIKTARWFSDLKDVLSQAESKQALQDLSRDRLKELANVAADAGIADIQAADFDVLVFLEDDGNQMIDEFLDRSESCRKALKAEMKGKGVEFKHDFEDTQENPVLHVDNLLALIDPQAKEKIVADYEPSVLKHAFNKLASESNKRLKRRMKEFEEMLADVICKPQHVDMTWETAEPKLAKEPEFTALKIDRLRRAVFASYMKTFIADQQGKKRALEDNQSDQPATKKPKTED